MHQVNDSSSAGQTHRIRVLGIAPYEGMKSIMQKIAGERTDIDLEVFVGDLHRGPEIVKQNAEKQFNIIISRGGTAELIRRETRIPVVEVGLSFYDILRAIKLTENYSGQYAIVAFPSITGNARLLCELLQYHIQIFTVHSQDEVQERLASLKEEGYQMVLCDMIAYTTARKLGLNAVLITSGAESISTAFDQAVQICGDYAVLQEENRFFREVLHCASEETLVLKESGEIFFCTAREELRDSLMETLLPELPAILSGKMQKFFRNLDGTQYSFICRIVPFLQERCVIFSFSASSVPFATSKYGIQYSNLLEEEDPFFDSFYSLTNVDTTVRASIDNLNQTRFPVMLSGESGSGKEQVARIIYSQSTLNTNPLITVNCALLNDRSWNFLTNHYNSPFNDNDNTIYLKDITALPDNRRKQLLSLIIDTNLCKRNRMIFSCTCPVGQGIPPEATEFVSLLSCITLHLPPLRENVDKIPSLAILYLNTINASMENQIIGLDPEATALLQSYSWPCNYTQFKRILSELALITDSPYIHAEQVSALLEKEMEPTALHFSSPSGSGNHYLLDLSQPLCEITKEIIQIVLAEENGNQSAAARRLDIGRSTIWRYLK